MAADGPPDALIDALDAKLLQNDSNGRDSLLPAIRIIDRKSAFLIAYVGFYPSRFCHQLKRLLVFLWNVVIFGHKAESKQTGL